MLRIGFGRADTTPAAGQRVLLAGRDAAQPAVAVAGRLGGRVLLADDGARRVAVVCLDLMALPAGEVETVRARLAAVGGLSPDAILVACSHTHGAPVAHKTGPAGADEVDGYVDVVVDRAAGAMAGAAADLRPAELVVGRTRAPGWVFNRRPIYAGDQVATHGVTTGAGFVRMEDEPDDELQILVVRDRAGIVRGGLVGYACHPTVMENEPVLSPDYAGALVEALEARHGGVFGFLLGAAGDTAPNDPASPDPLHGQGAEHLAAMGLALADRAEAAIGAGRTVVAADRVGAAKTRLRIPQRRPTEEQAALARWYLEAAPRDLDERAFTRRLTGRDHTFWDVPPRANERHARRLLGMWEWQRHAETREPTEEVEVQTLTVGDAAVVAVPGELFTAFGRRLKSASPFPHTFVATQANGWHGYLPTPAAFERGGYETVLANVSRLVPEAGDRITDAALELLRDV